MTDRTTSPANDAPDSKNNSEGATPDRTPDRLTALYREATAHDAGPSDAARQRILAHARQQAAARQQTAQYLPHKEAANDRRWLRHALGSIAVIGIVGLLSMNVLQEQHAPVPTGEIGTSTRSQSASPAEAVEPSAPPSSEAPAAAADQAPAAAEVRRSESRKEHSAEKRLAAPAPVDQPVAPQLENRSAEPTSAPFSLPAPVAPAPAPAPAQEPAPPALSSTAPATPRPRAAQEFAKSRPLPDCDPTMDAEAQAEQARRIQQREAARAEGRPLPKPAPICKPVIPVEQGADGAPADKR